jgi:hypothetical protein
LFAIFLKVGVRKYFTKAAMNHQRKAKKIFSVSIVKNEMDIIETFVRYNCMFLDGMVILNNHSDDGTPSVLQSLAEEGLPIFILNDPTLEFDQITKTVRLVQSTFEEQGADVIMPLDADEFLITAESLSNPRPIIEDLDSDAVHYVKWRTYIPYPADSGKDACLMQRMQYIREEKAEEYWKVLIPRHPWIKHRLSLIKGNHDVVPGIPKVGPPPKKKCDRLRLAHFPVRSREQILAKFCVGWINILASHNHTPGESFHVESGFNRIKSGGSISNQDLIILSKEYSSSWKAEAIELVHHPIGWPDFDKIQARYSNQSPADWIALTLSNVERLAIEQSGLRNELEKLRYERDVVVGSILWKTVTSLRIRVLTRLLKGGLRRGWRKVRHLVKALLQKMGMVRSEQE